MFSLEEARDIAIRDVVPKDAPADAHDVAATYRLVSSNAVMTIVPTWADEFFELLEQRHRELLAGRPEKRPGQYKTLPNYAGSGGYRFVDPTRSAGPCAPGSTSSSLRVTRSTAP